MIFPITLAVYGFIILIKPSLVIFYSSYLTTYKKSLFETDSETGPNLP